jgi:phosphatidylinositol alpha 1,6-mannosyltransferase
MACGGEALRAVRVAIVTESFLPTVNGVSNSVQRILEHLNRCGHLALVLAPGAGPDSYAGFPVVRVPALDLPVVDSLPVGVPTRRIYTALADFRPDLVHLASPFVLGPRGLAAAKRLGVPAVAVYQTDIAGFATAYGLSLTARAAWRWIRRTHTRADRTLAPSSAAVQALREHGVPRVHLWARGVDTDRFAPARRDPALRATLAPGGELLVGYVGRLAPEKRVQRLVALHGLPGMRLVIIGDGPDRRTLQARLPGAAFLGFRTGDELASAYASLDVFVHTGPFETFCQAVQEALASGLPVVAPNAGGPRDLVVPGRTGFLVPDGDHGMLRRAVCTLADPGLRRRFSAAARTSVLNRTWPAVCDQLLNHYAAVTARPTIQAA